MKPDAATVSVYNAKTQEYKNLSKTDKEVKVEAKFVSLVKPGGTVLDYGCGPGRTAGYFAQKGLVSHAFDASEEMVQLASAREGVQAWQAGFHDFEATQFYDGIWASFSLLHAPRRDIAMLLSAIKTALKPQGIFYLGLKLGSGEARDSLGRFYTYYEQDEVADLLKTHGFTWLSHKTGEDVGLDGTSAAWIGILSRA